MKHYFTPAPLCPPAAPKAEAGLKGYIEYVSTWDLYVSHLKSSQANWKNDKKENAAVVKAAAQRGCVVKTAFKLIPTDQTKREVNEQGALVDRSVRVNVVKTVRKEVPQEPPQAKSDVAKAVTRHAKRVRYRKNRKLRKAKAEAELTFWQLRVKKNQDKLKPKPPKAKAKPGPVPKAKGAVAAVVNLPKAKPPATPVVQAKPPGKTLVAHGAPARPPITAPSATVRPRRDFANHEQLRKRAIQMVDALFLTRAQEELVLKRALVGLKWDSPTALEDLTEAIDYQHQVLD